MIHNLIIVNIFLSLTYFFSLFSIGYSQMTLGGPGVLVAEYLYSTPSYKTFNLGYYYLYEIHGFYGRTDADQVPDTYVDNGGVMRFFSGSAGGFNFNGGGSFGTDRGGQQAKGWVHAAVALNNQRYPRKMLLQTNKVQTNTGDQIYTGSILRVTDQNVELGFYINGNTLDPDGYMVAFGATMKQAPRPTGKLTTNNFTQAGKTIDVSYTIDIPDYNDTTLYDWNPQNWLNTLSEPTSE